MGVGVNWTKERRVNKMLNSIIVKPYHVDLMKMKDVKEFTHRLKHMIMLLELLEKDATIAKTNNKRVRIRVELGIAIDKIERENIKVELGIAIDK